MVAISFACIQEERLNHEVRRTRVTPRPAMPRPTTPSTAIRAPAPRKLTRDELREYSAKWLCWHCNEPWSRKHRRKKGRLLVIEPVEDEDSEPSEEGLEPEEEATKEEPQPADYVFDVKVTDDRILNCDQRCPRVKLLLQDQEVVADFFLLPINDYEAVLGIEWLTMLGDISWNFSKLIMKFYCKGRQVTLRGKRGSHISTVSTQWMEKVLHKAH
ncbi:hypothetical protein GW17_00024984 [Ensete ventricosum]|nr:hypothetical protein GW17_00024984 [Ensete ventricosum]